MARRTRWTASINEGQTMHVPTGLLEEWGRLGERFDAELVLLPNNRVLMMRAEDYDAYVAERAAAEGS